MAASTLYTTGMEHSPVGRHRVGAHAVARDAAGGMGGVDEDPRRVRTNRMPDSPKEKPKYTPDKFAPGTRRTFFVSAAVIALVAASISGAFGAGAVAKLDWAELLFTLGLYFVPVAICAYWFYTLGRNDGEWWLRYAAGQEQMPLPKRLQRMLWAAARAEGRNPGPEPSDLRGTLKMMAFLIGAMSTVIVPMGVGLYVADKLLGWSPLPALALSFVFAGVTMWLLARCAEFIRRRSRR